MRNLKFKKNYLFNVLVNNEQNTKRLTILFLLLFACNGCPFGSVQCLNVNVRSDASRSVIATLSGREGIISTTLLWFLSVILQGNVYSDLTNPNFPVTV